MRLGIHIRIADGLTKGLDRAAELGCEAVQLFSQNPNAWAVKPLEQREAEAFREKAAALDIHPIVLHTPYLVNLASPDDDIWEKSIGALTHAVIRAGEMGAGTVVTHIGSHKGAGYEFGVQRICEAVRRSLGENDGPVVALELGSGSGASIGSTFEEVADVLACLDEVRARVGIGIDTAHLYGAGYDISTPSGVRDMFGQMEALVGSDRLRLVHLNDTLMELGSHRDRHHHIGRGNIGIKGFAEILCYHIQQDTPGIIETPGDTIAFDQANLDVLRRSCR
jgi:deoxyribonuclease IV